MALDDSALLAATVLDELGVTHDGVKVNPGFALLESHDLDGIALELICPA